MRTRRTASLAGLGILIVSTLLGCNGINLTNEQKEEPVYTFVSMEEDPVLNYEVPQSSPHILVDQLGYLPDSTKQVFFFGKEIPSAFKVIETDTGLTVYSGKTQERGYNKEYDVNISFGDFTELKKEGNYYIEANLLGSSYSFDISKNIYDEIFDEACKTFYYNRCGMTLTEVFAKDKAHNACHTDKAVLREDMKVTLDVSGGWHQDATGSMDVVKASEALANILLAYEVFPGAFKDEDLLPESGNGIPDILDEVKYEIDWLLKMQDTSTGAVYSAITVVQSADKSTTSYLESSNIEATEAFAFSLAKFSYLYQKFDREYATKCLQASDRAWKYCTLNEKKQDSSQTDTESPWKMAAAAEIYRASGLKDCQRYLMDFFAKNEENADLDGIVFYGYVTYLNTKQNVDAKICERLIKQIMKKAEGISEESRKSPFLVPSNKDQSNNNELLDKMITLTLVDYIITNHEYDTVIENYLHYFLGRNPMSVTYLDNVGTYSYTEIHSSLGLMKQFGEASKLIFMLSKIKEQQNNGIY